MLVLYFDTPQALEEATARMAQPTVVTANPYWRQNARAYEDPAGFLVLLALAAWPEREQPFRAGADLPAAADGTSGAGDATGANPGGCG
jgi:hypothetical protein